MNQKRIKVKIGDVFEVPLTNGQYAYGRVYDDAGVGIYNYISETPDNPPIGIRDFWFCVGMYEDVLTKGQWKIIGNDPFDDGESPFPPPNYIKDPLTNDYSVYHKGEIRSASKKEILGLEKTAVWDAHHIMDRIMTISS